MPTPGTCVRLVLRPKTTPAAQRTALIAAGDLIDNGLPVVAGYTPYEVSVNGTSLGVGNGPQQLVMIMRIPTAGGDWLLDTNVPLTTLWANQTQASPGNRPWGNKFVRALRTRWAGRFDRVALTSDSPLDPDYPVNIDTLDPGNTGGMLALFSI